MADWQGYTVLFLIWLVSAILVRVVLNRTWTKPHLPPSPLALPIIGHLHLVAPIPHQAFHKLSIQYGPLFHVFLGSVPCVVVSTAEMAREFLKTYEEHFSNRPVIAAVDYLTYGSQDFSFAPYGPYWKFMKKLCMSELLGGRTLGLLLPVRSEEIKRFVQFMLRKAKESKEVDVGRELIRMSNNMVSRMLMGQRCSDKDEQADEMRKLVHEVVELTGKFNLTDFIWFCKNLDLQGFKKRLKEVRDRFDSMMERIIDHKLVRRKRKETGGSAEVKDLLDILLNVAEDENSEMRLSKENIKAFILDIFAAGTDTAAITIEWALSELINHPDIMEKARQEIDMVVGKNRLVEESDIPNLPYLQAIAKETLRLHPSGPMIVRESTETCVIGGYEIPAGTRLFVNLWSLGRDPSHWEDPLEFRPERFTSGSSQHLELRGQHFQLMPFGSGRRGCPGTSLALQVVQATLGSMIQCFEWKLSGGENGRVNMEEAPGLTLLRAHPLICIPVARLDPFPSSQIT
ncbi:3,9-dihydroxypterocarpan 6A-monooxygenase [Punica granatum]|uniref:Uncharacterized protein n=2 Tax=Punica granatum TaxID=22663 RepID=A0A218XBS6_PUNGR|nr:3,9-dihydroxypterocarpan 6A-monooxygenase [Punica granatum]OWM82675.1 hypothetical protein CDL15_Pgr002250 [Punica granatum]PKI54206.1 hypothetical protein CRG98_025439 [Punica granatum]